MLINRWGRVVLDLSAYDAVGNISEGMLAVNKGRQLSHGRQGRGHRYLAEEGLWGFIRLMEVNLV